jgi:putative addiction module component (TIGR02574 family)
MNAAIKTLTDEAGKLTLDERMELVDKILATMHPTASDIEQAWKIEIKGRFDAYRRGEMEAKDFDEVMRKYDRS